MKTLVVYYSRTGTTKKAAETLAKELNADIEEVIDKKKRSGIFGYLRAGRDAMRKKLTEIEPMKKDPNSYELTIIGLPVWVGSIPPAIRTYLKDKNMENKKVAILITLGGSGDEKAVVEIKSLIPKAIMLGYLAIKRRDIEEREKKIREWVERLNLNSP